MRNKEELTVNAMEIADAISEMVLHPKNASDALALNRRLESVLLDQVALSDNVTYITKA